MDQGITFLRCVTRAMMPSTPLQNRHRKLWCHDITFPRKNLLTCLWIFMKLKLLFYLSMYTKCVYRINSASTCLCFCMFLLCCFYLLCAGACFTRVWVFVCYPAYVHSCLSTVWPSCTLPAVLTLVCVDSKHSCRSQRPRSGRTRGSEGQWWRGEREGAGRQEMEGEIRGKGSSLVRYRARKRKEKC